MPSIGDVGGISVRPPSDSALESIPSRSSASTYHVTCPPPPLGSYRLKRVEALTGKNPRRFDQLVELLLAERLGT